ncbi:penicillin acylase family protein [Roseateles paludis]|uniref:Penicillin acylase family protein n=1 Tax=Roseateles paludis TaxID=3145238 RepID=A0ABV0G5J1_9BURK
MRWIKRLTLCLLALVLLLAAVLTGLLRGSLAQLDGERNAGAADLAAPVELQRDARGYLSVVAESRLDAARALGFAHAQERFFQMDLLRRNAAGELAALVGPKAVPLDKGRRVHRFRARAEAALAALEAPDRQLLDAYAAGANAGLAALSVRPPEYLLLRQTPAAWRAADTLLVTLSMYLDLQRGQGRDELAMGALHSLVQPDWYAFLTQHSSDYQAALDDSRVDPVPVPASPWPAALRAAQVACSDCRGTDARDIGSNNFAVSAAHATHGHAMVADDMHLGLRVPGTWFKARLQWKEQGATRDVTGVTLPGTPLVVAGSNGQVAWGFTNTTSDWTDVIRLQLSADGQAYRNGGADKPFVRHLERIEVAGAAAESIEVLETDWGPVLEPAGQRGPRHALRWVAYDPQGLNVGLRQLERAATVDEAVRAAAGMGLPAQNLMLADRSGRIAWTVAGAIPRRVGSDDPNRPQDWSDGKPRWQGYLGPDEQPRVLDPADGRLWTANSRMVGGAALAKLGNGGYDLGARAQQIRDALRAQDRFDEAGLHAIQLDHRALFLARWQRLLLDRVLTPEFVASQGLQAYRQHVEQSSEAARVDAVGYVLVREFRATLLELLFAPLAGQLEAQGHKFADLRLAPEVPGWALIRAGRPDTLPEAFASWQALLQAAVLRSRDALIARHGTLDQATWGRENPANVRHPLSAVLPPLARWLDMPQQGLAGDRHMPRVHAAGHGQSERMVVAPGHEEDGWLVLPGGQSGHPLSPFYAADHAAWVSGERVPFLPEATRHRLILRP